MAKLRLSGWGLSEQDLGVEPHRLSSPLVFFWSQVIFLIMTGFLAAILYRQISAAFFANPGLNGLILFVLAIGVLLAVNQVLRLRPEVSWVNSFRQGSDRMRGSRSPTLLAPMRVLLSRKQSMSLSTTALRSILDSIATRLDESRDTSRYMIGLLVFLGLLGTFWGLLQTIGSINTVIQSLDPGSGNTNDILQELKDGLEAPLAGMGTAFSSSLFGLAGSLVLGFLDLQAGRAQNRFYTELENWLSTVTDPDFDIAAPEIATGAESSEDIRRLSETVQTMAQAGGGINQRSTAAMANLAEGIQGLVKNMRNEQQMLRDWIEAQQSESRAMRQTLDSLGSEIGKLDGGNSKKSKGS
ncbi:MotA/TolQ/ExbB proton channel family protein [Hoeflea poritis]|uniref:MotA/TolQ/ExbB proton channel family protein n=1 Tax=Hoeflea poritis TaxID=2993659 RepID=A0ABT4VQV8_9HYPH|nr:MotA/TolQ/ExbB proton channel family protein [Hoeflea poritis]MDA4847093.1 MotA/TolQ/ExbB proton channel family protein [Hoeflea poritis]